MEITMTQESSFPRMQEAKEIRKGCSKNPPNSKTNNPVLIVKKPLPKRAVAFSSYLDHPAYTYCKIPCGFFGKKGKF